MSGQFWISASITAAIHIMMAIGCVRSFRICFHTGTSVEGNAFPPHLASNTPASACDRPSMFVLNSGYSESSALSSVIVSLVLCRMMQCAAGVLAVSPIRSTPAGQKHTRRERKPLLPFPLPRAPPVPSPGPPPSVVNDQYVGLRGGGERSRGVIV
jgi:hypothetical protein